MKKSTSQKAGIKVKDLSARKEVKGGVKLGGTRDSAGANYSSGRPGVSGASNSGKSIN